MSPILRLMRPAGCTCASTVGTRSGCDRNSSGYYEALRGLPTMSWPAYRPMPSTDGMTIRDAASTRSAYRRAMMQRWRNPELRAEDRSNRRLPQDWHDWMDCPGEYGYKSAHCSCDTWLDRARRPSTHPRLAAEQGRVTRAKFEELIRSKVPTRPRRQIEESLCGVVWVKSVDTKGFPTTLASHAHNLDHHSQLAIEPLEVDSELLDPAHHHVDASVEQAVLAGSVQPEVGPEAAAGHSRRKWLNPVRGGHHQVGLGQPAWAVASGHQMSLLRARGRPDG